jgi:hypothetical protein
MTGIAAASGVLTAAAALVLLLRLLSASRDGRARLGAATATDDFPDRVLRLVRISIDSSLLTEAGPGGLADVAVRSRESQDPYRTVADLTDWLARQSSATGYPEVCGLVKGVYQLANTLRAPQAEVRHCLEPLIARVRATKVGGIPVARVECITPGTMLDPGTMAPLNYGARVSQPLGVLVYDAGGKVIGKAKVLCG